MTKTDYTNYPLIVLDYLLQTYEKNGKMDGESARKMLDGWMHTKLMVEEYYQTCDLMNRILKIAEKGEMK